MTINPSTPEELNRYTCQHAPAVRQWLRQGFIRSKYYRCRPSGLVQLLWQEMHINLSEEELLAFVLTEGFRCSSRDFDKAFLNIKARKPLSARLIKKAEAADRKEMWEAYREGWNKRNPKEKRHD
jgi:hypothetical protein